ncbi:MAG: LytR/AlgR family response regulator transcription factor [Actinomycetota bacterium]
MTGGLMHTARMAVRVLIVDDHAGFRARAREMLQGDGLNVVGEAIDGVSAIEAVRALRPDLVLLDVRLPDLNGFDVAEKIASIDAPPAIVMTSSHDARDFRRRIEASVARGFLAKNDLSGQAILALLGRAG